MQRRLLFIDPPASRWRLETMVVETLEKDPREDYLLLSGETLCQYLLRRDPQAMIIARGPMPFLSGNKATIGYVSPATGLPHYSFVGGRAASQLLNLGLDAVVLEDAKRDPASTRNQASERGNSPSSPLNSPLQARHASAGPPNLTTEPGNTSSEAEDGSDGPCVVLSGRAPSLSVQFKSATGLPTGQRGAYYWLLDSELGGDRHSGSIFTIGEGARLGYTSANLAVEAIYHAGRGGAGKVFARFASGLVLRADPVSVQELLATGDAAFARNPNGAIASLLDVHCARLSSPTGGTITKLPATGADPDGRNTLPALNASQLGYAGASLGQAKALRATRDGQTGCHWCQVDCRHYHWVPADYAPEGRDTFLDDFEPTYALFAMLGLAPDETHGQDWLGLRAEVDERLILPIEQMGCDAIEIGLALAALFEGAQNGSIPAGDLPESFAAEAEVAGRLEAAVQAVALLRSGQAREYPALYTAGGGPQALARAYPEGRDSVFTGGKGTLGNAGHANALWTFLTPFSRFFGHYVGQLYKIDEELPLAGSPLEAYQACFERVVQRALQKEYFWVLCNALSMCAFTFAIFGEDGQGEQLRSDGLLEQLLRQYGIRTTRADLEWFAQTFWAQSIDLKRQYGWEPLEAGDFPRRIYEALSLALERPPEELQELMDLLIDEWKRQAGEVLCRFGYQPDW